MPHGLAQDREEGAKAGRPVSVSQSSSAVTVWFLSPGSESTGSAVGTEEASSALALNRPLRGLRTEGEQGSVGGMANHSFGTMWCFCKCVLVGLKELMHTHTQTYAHKSLNSGEICTDVFCS